MTHPRACLRPDLRHFNDLGTKDIAARAVVLHPYQTGIHLSKNVPNRR